jgi:hypothetical protein
MRETLLPYLKYINMVATMKSVQASNMKECSEHAIKKGTNAYFAE